MIDVDCERVGALFKSAEDADSMKQLCANHYGHAGRLLIPNAHNIKEIYSRFNPDDLGEAVAPIAKRARKRFALVAAVGMAAVRYGVVPWQYDDVLAAVKRVFECWHETSSSVSDIDRGVQSVMDFMLEHEARFQKDKFTEHDAKFSYTPQNRAGWVKDDLYHFTSKAFKESCNGADAEKVKRAIKELGFLYAPQDGRLTNSIKVDGETRRVVSVKSGILSKSLKNGGNPGNPLTLARVTEVTT
ncbi:MAG: hypothetical protein KZQ58_13455 [gamma proteobacterium symbiont of Bathyaustriella thionipta]|nr:hypothetical protein [gamma proteobacterium symbiont of Bathyaustriella thionipta]